MRDQGKSPPAVPARRPPWLKTRIPTGGEFVRVRELVERHGLHTVCQSARCPNIGHCWSRRTATFMILGNVCTRSCRFCAVAKGIPQPVDLAEPRRVAEAVQKLGLRYAVITSVTRDDLPDGGASLFAQTIREIRKRVPDCRVEVLIPDFRGSRDALELVLEARPDVLNHNLETVPSLYSLVRPQADYRRSLQVLAWAHQAGVVTKSGLMLGLGETQEEVRQVLWDLRDAGCTILTLGQYLQPSAQHLPVLRFVPPEEFSLWRQWGLSIGFRHVEAGPLVRSSFHAEEQAGHLAGC
ncbi:MAG: lipoyl synthase [candidate division KSB1 bacterium]|nr:lipoyl synthase [candidate division KSB1 bacterium]